MKDRRLATLVVTLLVLVAAVMLSACGGDSSSTGSSGSESVSTESDSTESGGGSSSSLVAEAEKSLEAISGPQGSFTAPPSSGPKATPGKKLYVVSYGQGIPYFDELGKELKQAADSLGWSMELWDGQFEPNQWLAGVRQGVTAQADGIIGLGLDCSTIKPGLEAAAAAGIPYVSIEGYDCDVLEPGDKPLFSWTVTYNEGSLSEWAEAGGKYQADWAIAHTEGKAKIIEFEETDAYTFRALIDGFEKEIAKCSECEVLDSVELTGTDYGPKLEQKAQQAILSNPDADIVFPSGSESVLDGGVAAAIRGSTSKPVSTGFEGDPASPANLASGVLGMTQNNSPGWEGYAAVDALVRLFAGQKPTTETGIGLRLVDKEHNLDSFEPYVAPVDYKAAYEKVWGVR